MVAVIIIVVVVVAVLIIQTTDRYDIQEIEAVTRWLVDGHQKSEINKIYWARIERLKFFLERLLFLVVIRRTFIIEPSLYGYSTEIGQEKKAKVIGAR
jgi:hypothetical protein